MEIIHDEFKSLLEKITPSKEILNLAIAVLEEFWMEEDRRKKEGYRYLSSKLKEVDESLDTYLAELISTKTRAVKDMLEVKIANLSAEKAQLEKKASEPEAQKADFADVLRRVLDTLKSPKSLWNESELEGKQVLQRLTFPQGVIFDQKAKKFRKPHKGLIYAFLEDISENKEGMVGLAGLEPATDPL